MSEREAARARPAAIVAPLAAASALTAVAAGAFGAHALEAPGREQAEAWVETGAAYQMWHALGALLSIALKPDRRAPPWLFLIGTALFSGSLYALAMGAPTAVAAAAPLGGLAFMAGWGALAWGLWRG